VTALAVDQELDASLEDVELHPLVRSVVDKVAQIAGLSRPFGLNDAIVYPTASIGRIAVVDAIASRTNVLNEADDLLAGEAHDLVERFLRGDERADAIDDVRQWRRHLATNDNLYAIPHAIRVLGRLADATDLEALLRSEQPAIVDLLCGIAPSMRDQLKLTITLTLADSAALIPAIASAMTTIDDSQSPVIERLEIARSVAVAGCLEFRILLRTDRIAPAELLDALLLVAAQTATAARQLVTTRRSFSWHPVPNLAVAQGFSLVKRYVQPLGLLDDLYDPEHGHVCVRRNVRLSTPSGGAVGSWLEGRLSGPL